LPSPAAHPHGPRPDSSLSSTTEASSTSLRREATDYPRPLQIGDRIYTRDDLLVGKTKIGYDNELCTATFDGNDLCHVIAVITGKGTLEINWLWAGRNNSTYGPPHFSGVIDGGTGAYANAKGQFDASLFADGQLRFTAKLG
jgi:hypothetical protein